MATVEDSVLRTEMSDLEPQEEDAPKCILFFNPMSWVEQISPHRRDETWSASLCQTFFSTSMGAQIPVITEKALEACGSRKFQIDHLSRVPTTRVPKRHTTGRLINSLTISAQHTKLKRNRSLKAGVIIVGTLN